MKYKVIFVNWTKPFFHRKDAEGYNKLKMANNTSNQYSMVKYELEITKIAVKSARKHTNQIIKLYTDDIGYEYYKNENVLDLFDEIDVDTLNEYNKSNVNAGKFWTSGKSIAMGSESSPYLFLDNDFILQSDIPNQLLNSDLCVTHWEVQRGDFFVSNDMVNSLEFKIDNFNQNMLMPNTSFVFMNNEELRKNYLKSHLNIINQNHKQIPEWLWLLSDQGILGYEARNLDCNVNSIEKKIYLAYWESHHINDKCGFAPMWIQKESFCNNCWETIDENKNKSIKYYHVWFDKYRMKSDWKFRNKRIKELNSILENEYI